MSQLTIIDQALRQAPHKIKYQGSPCPVITYDAPIPGILEEIDGELTFVVVTSRAQQMAATRKHEALACLHGILGEMWQEYDFISPTLNSEARMVDMILREFGQWPFAIIERAFYDWSTDKITVDLKTYNQALTPKQIHTLLQTWTKRMKKIMKKWKHQHHYDDSRPSTMLQKAIAKAVPPPQRPEINKASLHRQQQQLMNASKAEEATLEE